MLIVGGVVLSSHAEQYFALRGADDAVLTESAVSQISRVTFTGGQVTIYRTDGTSSVRSFDAISRITLGEYSKVLKIEQDATNAISINDDMITLSGITNGATLNVYSANGALVKSSIVANDAQVSVADLAAGIYIINVDGVTRKFIKR